MVEDEESGKSYYVHSTSGASQWTVPDENDSAETDVTNPMDAWIEVEDPSSFCKYLQVSAENTTNVLAMPIGKEMIVREKTITLQFSGFFSSIFYIVYLRKFFFIANPMMEFMDTNTMLQYIYTEKPLRYTQMDNTVLMSVLLKFSFIFYLIITHSTITEVFFSLLLIGTHPFCKAKK